MIQIKVKKQSSYPVATKKIKERLVKFFEDNGIVSDSVASVALVGEKHALRLASDYLNEDPPTVHNVLSFTEAETQGEFISPPSDVINLGEIVVCFPKARDEAIAADTNIENYVIDLIEHGALHLMGIHHD